MSKIAKIERITYRGWGYSLEVEEDESFVANGIVVHNCEEGVNPEAKFSVISKAFNGPIATETYQGIPLIKRRFQKVTVRDDPEMREQYPKTYQYLDFQGGKFTAAQSSDSELNDVRFVEYATVHNKADRDSGELDDIAEDEVVRLGKEFKALDEPDKDKYLVKRLLQKGFSQPYYLLHGDSEEVQKQLPAKSVACVVTSPSYWGPRMAGLSVGELGGESEVTPYINKLVAVFDETRRVLKDDGSLWVILGNGGHGSPTLDVPLLFRDAMQKVGWVMQARRVWDKGSISATTEFVTKDSLFHFTKGEVCYEDVSKPLAGVIRLDPITTPGSRFRQFPPELAEMLILRSCPPGEMVLDPFVGTGVMLEAARNLGRPGIGIDINSKELDIAAKRIGVMGAYGGMIQKEASGLSETDLAKTLRSDVNVVDLMKYFSCFRNLFSMYHDTGGLDVVLYDPIKGEVILAEDDD